MSNMPAKLPNLMAFDEQYDSDSTHAKVKIRLVQVVTRL